MSRDGGAGGITAVLVNTNDGPAVGIILDWLQEEVDRVTVVDNASTDGSLRYAEGRPRVSIVRNDSNRGFSAASNQGAALAEGEWVLFVNPDINPRKGDVSRLLSGLAPDVAVAAPLQVDAKGHPRPESGGYEPTLLRHLVWALVPARFHGRMGPWLAPPFPARDVDVDWVSGALLAVRRDVWVSLGGFDERFFLYEQDVDLGRRARAAGHRVVLRPAVRLEHAVSHGDPERRAGQVRFWVDDLAADFPPWKRPFLGLVLALGFLLRAVAGSPAQRAMARAGFPKTLGLIRPRPGGRGSKIGD